MRNLLRVFAFVLAVVVAVTACGAANSSTNTARKHKRHRHAAAKKARIGPALFGFNDNSVLMSESDPATAVERSAGAGANVVRYTVDWDYVEAQPGQWNWHGYDPLYADAIRKGIRPILVAAFAPSWARPLDMSCGAARDHCHDPTALKYDSAWVNFIHELVKRYPKAAAVEVWNEPNLINFWHQGPSAQGYAHVLNLAYQAVKDVDPGMTVLGGALNNTEFGGNGSIPYEQFVNDLLALAPKMDALSIHDYATSGTGDWFDKTLDIARSALDSHGYQGVPIWVTEIGASTAGEGAIPEPAQATELVDELRKLGGRPDVKAGLVHTIVPAPVDPSSTEYGFAVMQRGGTPKPAYCALAAARLEPRPAGCPQ